MLKSLTPAQISLLSSRYRANYLLAISNEMTHDYFKFNTSKTEIIITPSYLLFLYLLGRECAFLTRSQMMLLQLVQDPHIENHCSNVCYPFLPLGYQISSTLGHDLCVAGSVNVSQHCILLNLESCNIAFQALVTKWWENTRDKTTVIPANWKFLEDRTAFLTYP